MKYPWQQVRCAREGRAILIKQDLVDAEKAAICVCVCVCADVCVCVCVDVCLCWRAISDVDATAQLQCLVLRATRKLWESRFCLILTLGHFGLQTSFWS